MNKLKDALKLFAIFFKIGLFTFGGGYAMISVITHEIVEKRKYISSAEFSDLVAIAESTPGPIAINSATYIGYRKAGVLGAIFSSIGVCLPSLIIIFLISLFFTDILKYTLVQKAFKGIQCGVSILVFMAGVKLLKNIEKNWISYTLITLSVLLMLSMKFFSYSFSTIFIVLFGAVLGIAVYLPKDKKADNRPIAQDSDKKEGGDTE
jgi:chromate transporter